MKLINMLPLDLPSNADWVGGETEVDVKIGDGSSDLGLWTESDYRRWADDCGVCSWPFCQPISELSDRFPNGFPENWLTNPCPEGQMPSNINWNKTCY